MKEYPISFSAQMVRPIIEGRKKQTRRVVNFPCWVSEEDKTILSLQTPATGLALYEDGRPTKRMLCPFGQPDDRLWVREPFVLRGKGESVLYKADFDTEEAAGLAGLYGGWKWSAFLPRKHARLILVNTGVSVQRLQDMTEEDAINEGFSERPLEGGMISTAYSEFSDYWDQINAKRALWKSNPFVWVVSFEVAQ